MKSSANGSSGAFPRAVDAAVLVGFALFAAAYFLGRWQGVHPFPYLGGDASNIASFAAALDHPERFARDAAMGDPSHFGFYFTVHLPLLRWLAPVFGSYGTAFVSLLPLHVFLQCAGFYWLGIVLFRHRGWALMLAAVNLAPIALTPETGWGVLQDPIPRFSFQALLPFVLAFALTSRDTPKRWPLVMLVAGLLIYVHPVSAPGWGFGLWLGWLAFRPANSTSRFWLVCWGSSAVVFLATSALFLIRYLTHHDHGVRSEADFDQVYAILLAMRPLAYFDVFHALRGFAADWAGPRALLWPWALLGAIWVSRTSAEARRVVTAVALWAAGLTIVSVGIPLAEQFAARAFRHLPVQVDLIRGLRYLVPIVLLGCVGSLAVASRRLAAHPQLRRGVGVVGFAFTVGWLAAHPPAPALGAMRCFAQGSFSCEPRVWQIEGEAISAVQQFVPPGSTLLASYKSPSLKLRHHGLVALAHCRKDLGVFMFANHTELLRWMAIHQRLSRVTNAKTPALRLRGISEIARRLHADYLLGDARCQAARATPGTRRAGLEVLWSNDHHSLMRVP